MKIEQDNWHNEGGHITFSGGRVVHTPDGESPYKVVLSNDGGGFAEPSFATIREAEAFIRRNTPLPAARCTLFDRAADEGLSSRSLNEVSA